MEYRNPVLSKFFSASFIMVMVSFTVVIVQVADMSAGESWTLKFSDRISVDHRIFYAVVLMLSVFAQIYFLRISTKIVFKTRKATPRSALAITYIHTVSQITVVILLVYLLGEQLVNSRYPIVLVQSIVGLSLIISILNTVSLASKCIRSYLATKSRVAAVYAFAIIALTSQLTSAFFYAESNLDLRPPSIDPKRDALASDFYTDLNGKLISLYESTRVISFIAVWIASLLLTKSYARKIGNMKYWTIVSTPIIYFLFQYSPLVLSQSGTLSSLLMSSGSIFPNLYNFILNTVNVGTALLFGISFFILSRVLTHDQIKYYLIVCGAGLMIVFTSSVSTILILSSFPAWGVISISFVLPSSFLILIGLDSVTFYVAGDIRVRSFLSNTQNQFELLRALGSAKASSEAERKIHQLIKQIHNNTEAEALFSPKLESQDIKQYVGEVIAELKNIHGKSSDTKSENNSDRSTV